MAEMAENQLKKDMKTQRLKMIGCLEVIASLNCAYPNLSGSSRSAISQIMSPKTVVPSITTRLARRTNIVLSNSLQATRPLRAGNTGPLSQYFQTPGTGIGPAQSLVVRNRNLILI